MIPQGAGARGASLAVGRLLQTNVVRTDAQPDVATIAETMGASISATRSRIFYAQKELRARAAADPYLREFVEESDVG